LTNHLLTFKLFGMKTLNSNQIDPDKTKGIFFKAGLCISMALVLAAFQYKAFDRVVITPGFETIGLIDDILIPVTFPKPPDPPPLPESRELITAPDELVTDEPDMVVNTEAHSDTYIWDVSPGDFTKPEPEIDDNFIFERPEVLPEFPGGLAALYQYLGKNIKYPRQAQELHIQGTVFISFVVERDGRVTQINLLRGIGGGCDEEAIRVVQNMPPWSPGKMGTQTVRASFTLPVRFLLQ
jgi:periplasmic protein TonB